MTAARAALLALTMTSQAVPAAWLESPAVDIIVATRLAVDSDAGQVQQAEVRIEPGLEGRLAGRWPFRLSARLRSDVADALEPGRPGNRFRDAASQRLIAGSSIDIALRDAYIDIDMGAHYLRLGKQQIVWGQADGLKVLDVLNPQSFREFILPDFDESRIPLWSANLELAVGESLVQIVWLPDLSYDELPDQDALFAFTSPLLVPSAPPGVPVTLLEPELPDRILADSDIGLRYSTFRGGVELSVNYLYHYVDRPALERLAAGQGVAIRPVYERSHLFGTSFNWAAGDWVTRGEFGYSTDRRWLSDGPVDPDDPHDPGGLDRSDEAAWVLGVDYQGVRDTFLSMQFFQSVLTDRGPRVTRKQRENSLTALVQRDFRNETLTTEALAIHGLADDDGVVQLSLAWTVRSNLVLRAGADLFYGRRAGLFGQFADRDRLSFEVELGL